MSSSNNNLQKLIENILTETLSEENKLDMFQTVSHTAPTLPAPGIPSVVKNKGKRQKKIRYLRDKFRSEPSNKSTMDIRTLEGRDNVLDKVYYEFGDVKARINIVAKLAQQAANAPNRQEFKAALVQIFDNLNSLKNKDLPKLYKGYTQVIKLIGGAKKDIMSEVILNPDTSEGRRNLIRKLYNAIGNLLNITEEGNKMLVNARNSKNISVFINEIKALGDVIRQIAQQLVDLNAAFVETFHEYERQRGRR